MDTASTLVDDVPGHCIQTVMYLRSIAGLVMLDAGGLELSGPLADLDTRRDAESAGINCHDDPAR